MNFLAFLLLGLIAGAIAKLILPGKQAGGWIMTLILGYHQESLARINRVHRPNAPPAPIRRGVLR